MDPESLDGVLLVSALGFSFVYLFLCAFFEHKRLILVHETSIAIVVGFLVGLVPFLVQKARGLPISNLINVNQNIVFFVLLPLMLFSDSFNLKKRRFFQNIFYINIYGILGTLFNFLTILGLLYLANYLNLIRDLVDINVVVTLNTWEIILFAATMCSIDPVAALSTIKPQVHPKLFSIIFGESLMKDVVTIVLFKSIVIFVSSNSGTSVDFSFVWSYPFDILGNFLMVVTVSILIGTFYGLLLTLMFKYCRFVVENEGVTELGLTFLCGFISYLTSEYLEFSGIVSLIVTGIFLSHFNIYNMSKNGLDTSRLASKTVSQVAEGLLFLIVGVSAWEFKDNQKNIAMSWTFVLLGIAGIFFARFINIALTSLLFYPCCKNNWRVNYYELEIIGVSGLVKGAVPFALITSLSISSMSTLRTMVMLKSSVIAIVFLTSVFFNGLIPMFITWKMRVIKERIKEDDQTAVDTLKEKELRNYQIQIKGETVDERKFRSQTQKYWKRFDEGFVKPFLIYNYKGRKEDIQLEKKRQRFEEFGIPINVARKEEIQMTTFRTSEVVREKGEAPKKLTVVKEETYMQESARGEEADQAGRIKEDGKVTQKEQQLGEETEKPHQISPSSSS